jgi:glycosyltransferase involved in cell wall biosynthesis
MNTTISLALIVRDSSATLDRCLSTFKELADEIVVVDTGSVDNTIEIAQKYTDKIYHFKWIDDFSAARNFSFEKCTKT